MDRMMKLDLGEVSLDLWGFLLLLGASLLSLASLLAPWLSLASNLLPAERFDLSLWGGCVVQEGGPLQCRPHPGLLALPSHLLWARVLTGLSLGSGLLALLLTAPGLQGVHSWGPRHKRALRGVGGALSLVAGLLVLVPVWHVACLATLSRYDPSLPPVAPRWEGAGALYSGWAAAGMHLGAGALLITSCYRRGGKERTPTPKRAPSGGQRMLEPRLSGGPATTEPPLSGGPATTEPPLSGGPATTGPPLSGGPATTGPPLSGGPATTEPPLSGGPATTEPPLSGGPATTGPPLSGGPATTGPPRSGGRYH
ncbi:claudin-1-like [Eleginops maclovinus]|uniref:claudin-1-like n=1 Tax=Eleginops maclovinus TaxID=56733 RepID=UPI0030810C1E